MRYLKWQKYINCDGVNDKNEKIWKLTEFGNKIAYHLNEIVKLEQVDKVES
jgi:hypothetical protein